jgi:hypothetical protein
LFFVVWLGPPDWLARFLGWVVTTALPPERRRLNRPLERWLPIQLASLAPLPVVVEMSLSTSVLAELMVWLLVKGRPVQVQASVGWRLTAWWDSLVLRPVAGRSGL